MSCLTLGKDHLSQSYAARVYVGGTFDLFHPGHVELLRKAATFGEVWVALNSDDYAERLKGKRPIMNYGERATMLHACEFVHGVVTNNGNEYDLLRLVQPTIIFYGNDGSYSRESYLKLFGLDEANLDAMGIKLIFPPRHKGVSSTEIIQRVIQRRSGQPRQPVRAPEDAGQPHVPDPAPRGDDCSCVGYRTGCCGEAQGGFPLGLIPSP